MLGRGGPHHEMLELFEAVLDTPAVAVPAYHPFDHADERLPVHLLFVGIMHWGFSRLSSYQCLND